MRRIKRILTAALAVAAIGIAQPAQAQPAPDANSVLILGSTVGPADPSLEESKATALGYTVVIDSECSLAGAHYSELRDVQGDYSRRSDLLLCQCHESLNRC